MQVGAPAAAQSVAGLRGCETGCVEAGQKVVLDFQPRDALGNVVRVAGWVLSCNFSSIYVRRQPRLQSQPVR